MKLNPLSCAISMKPGEDNLYFYRGNVTNFCLTFGQYLSGFWPNLTITENPGLGNMIKYNERVSLVLVTNFLKILFFKK